LWQKRHFFALFKYGVRTRENVFSTEKTPAASTTSEQVTLVPIFYTKNQSPAPLFLLFRKKPRSAPLFVCKRSHDGSLSLPPFYDCACGTFFHVFPSSKLRLFRFFMQKNQPASLLFLLPKLFKKFFSPGD